ncbi:MAG: hypothetical protein LBL58_18870 [Tannerellaceae bacterium]|jgi:hypothetical protein|nr:hypothetical protein [Tannerellaceae bacterium]
MKGIINVSGIFFCLMSVVYGQKNTWSIGFYTALRGEVMQEIGLFQELDLETGKMNDFFSEHLMSYTSFPPLMLTVTYNITNNLSIISGIGYNRNHIQWKASRYAVVSPTSYETIRYQLANRITHHSLQLPLLLKLQLPIKQTGLSIFSIAGIIFDFQLYSNALYAYDDAKIDTVFCPNIEYNGVMCNQIYIAGGQEDYIFFSLNPLVNTGIGLTYTFKKGFSISISGEYFLGTRRYAMLKEDIQYTEIATNIVHHREKNILLNKNNYWNVGFAVSYTFKQKAKE